MTEPRPPRKPEVIAIDDPDLVLRPEGLDAAEARAGAAGPAAAERHREEEAGLPPRATGSRAGGRGFGWGALLVSALGLLAGLALTLSFTRFVSAALERHDWIGWLAVGLLAVAGLALAVICVREVITIARLGAMARTRRNLADALARRDAAAERAALEAAFRRLAGRPELKWSLARLSDLSRNAHDPGDLARLVDREVMPALDGDARRLIASSARRVGVVTALSPMAALTVGWILVENLRLLRALAALYGGRPGFLGTTRLARMVATHIIASGGLALTDDLLGQFLGQDLVRRLSRRLGESVFNAALTARVGAAAVEVVRPLPYIEAPRVRARDFVAEIVRMQRGEAPAAEEARKGR